MSGDHNISYSLMCAVREGNVERVRELILLVYLTHKHGQKGMLYFVLLLRKNVQKLLNYF